MMEDWGGGRGGTSIGLGEGGREVRVPYRAQGNVWKAGINYRDDRRLGERVDGVQVLGWGKGAKG